MTVNLSGQRLDVAACHALARAAAASFAARCGEGSEPADNAEKEKDAGDDVRNDEWREALDAAMRVVR